MTRIIEIENRLKDGIVFVYTDTEELIEKIHPQTQIHITVDTKIEELRIRVGALKKIYTVPLKEENNSIFCSVLATRYLYVTWTCIILGIIFTFFIPFFKVNILFFCMSILFSFFSFYSPFRIKCDNF